MEIKATISGDKELALELDEFTDQVRAALTPIVQEATDHLEALVLERAPYRTGRLKTEIGKYLDVVADSVRGKVKVTVPSGDINELRRVLSLEYGAFNTTSVRAHASTVSTVFGRFIDPMRVLVDAYSRRPNIEAEDFMRGPLAEISTITLDRMREAVEQLARQG
jgi:hypothetical protein